MNQSIIFTDQLFIEKSRVKFIAQQQGVNINCFVSFGVIGQLCGQQAVNQLNAADAFEQCRFDLEEKAEELIEQELFNDDGDIVL
ncbi:DUF1488 domain-containing protein [Shewanella inventionis]|uniref:Transcriptional regulator n=1 Tax=Shewanella inventionis TaxID=1738770 RepID=A0ABQ1JD78_9GAMM|nr:DUF1488 domain-containing protein [Shewanella inventionis]MCL1158023.1 DUF1488 domain-containing protein [Shewanella inventionis]UAL43754.1 DUF1488 domain-containing protein [Shewanella inventionis]GGB65847.1 transcriptional regulator [Shewanella inventionis]